MGEDAVHILHGPVGSGKTTALINRFPVNRGHGGILTPRIDELRYFLDLRTGERFRMEADKEESPVLEVGRLRFSLPGFEKANQVIRESFTVPGWLVVDEIGPLELRGEGFHDSVKVLLNSHHPRLLLVVREGLLEQVTHYFSIQNKVTIHADQLDSLTG